MLKAYINGKCHILDDERNVTEAILVEDNIIKAIGTTEKIMSMVGDGDIYDLKGRVILPGFNDSHMHLLSYAYGRTIADLEDCTSREMALNKIQQIIRDNKIPEGHWVEAAGWNNDNWEDKRNLTKEDLDQVSTRHPIYAVRICGHISALNTMAMEKMGLNSNYPQPSDGHYEVDENGNPTGSIAEMMNRVYNAIPEPDIDTVKKLILNTCQEANAVGITSIQTDDFDTLPGRNFDTIIKAYKELIEEGKLTLRITQQCAIADLDRLAQFENAGYCLGQGDKFFKLGSVKLYLDGSLGSRTAWLNEDYSDDPGNKGFQVYTEEAKLFAVIEEAQKRKADVLMHCIGDAATDQAIRGIENAMAKYPAEGMRHGIVHAQILNKNLLDKMAKEHIMAYIQPIFIEYDLHMAESRIGEERMKTSYNWKTMENMGIVLSMGTDCPVESFNPMLNIYSAVTRKDLDKFPEKGWYPEEALSLDSAIKGYTVAGAYMSHDEQTKGKLLPGMLADFVVLHDDIYNIPYENIKDISIDLTVIDGNICYKA